MHFSGVGSYIDPNLPEQGTVSAGASHTENLIVLYRGHTQNIRCYPSELSGGQQQRVAIARALAGDPDIIYFDEPTSALDPELTRDVLSILKELAQQGLTMVVVTHELTFAKNIANKVVFMEAGHVVEAGDAQTIFGNPKEL